MQEKGLGVELNETKAEDKFKEIMNASFHGKIPKISLIPSSFGFLKIYAKRVLKRVVGDGERLFGFFGGKRDRKI